MTRRHLVALVLVLCGAATADAQPDDRRVVSRGVETDGLALRPFVMGTHQTFEAAHTFEAVFGRSHEPFFGGGLQVVFKGRYYAEVVASRFRKTGERAVRVDGKNFRLGLPLTAEIKPLEVTGGYRFDMRPNQPIVPYAGGGIGTYAYKESSPSSDPEENIAARHRGFVLTGGVEIRLHRWIRVDVDEQYTRVPGILGLGGISKTEGEDDLGGLAVRVKIVVGR